MRVPTVVTHRTPTATPIFLAALAIMLALAPSVLAQGRTLGPENRAEVQREPAIVNGTAISIRQAPWQVYLLSTIGPVTSACGGSIINPTTVVTAAHCAFDDNGVARLPASFQLRAGISNAAAPAAGDEPQTTGVSGIRVHPGYDSVAGPGSPDDVAVLTLSSPLTLGRATAQPIAPSTAAPTVSSVVNITGFGQQDPNAQPNGQLFGLNTTVNNPLTCGGPANALYVCIVSSTGSACRGDSGGPMTQGTGGLVGVASFVTGPNAQSICRPGTVNGYTNVTAGEINAFIAGDNTPPLAPRGGEDVSAVGTFREGGSITCSPGSWSNGPTFTYTIINTQNGRALQSGPSRTYNFTQANVGQTVACLVSAANAGGTGIALTEASPAIVNVPGQPDADPGPDTDSDPDPDARPRRPRLAVSISASRRVVRSGGRVSFAIRVSNRGRARARRVVVCYRPGRGLAFGRLPNGGRRSNGRACFRISALRAGRGRTVRITVRTTRTNRTRLAINRVAAQARNARTVRRDSVRVIVRGAQRRSQPPPAVTGRFLGF